VRFREWKGGFVKNNMTRDDYVIGVAIKAKIALVVWGVTKKDA
jgi:hypothetical protein